MQVINGPLGVRSRLKDGAIVGIQDLEPMVEVGGMVVAWLRRDAEVAAQERGPDLGDQFFAGVTFVAELPAAEITVESG